MSRWFLAALLGLFVGLWEIAVLPFLPAIFGLKPIIPVLVLLLVGSGRAKAFVTAIATGLVVDIFSVVVFDVSTIRLVGIVFFLDFLAQRLLTNRSLYTALALVLIGRSADFATSWLFSFFDSWISSVPFSWSGGANLWMTVGWDLLTVGIGFFLIAAFTKRFVTFVHRTKSASFPPYGKG